MPSASQPCRQLQPGSHAEWLLGGRNAEQQRVVLGPVVLRQQLGAKPARPAVWLATDQGGATTRPPLRPRPGREFSWAHATPPGRATPARG